MATETAGALTLREADEDDLDQMVEMHGRCSSESLALRYFVPLKPGREMLQRLMRYADQTLVATVDGTIVGIASVASDPGEAPEIGVLVEDAHQRNGIGRRLLAAAVQVARDGGADEVIVATLAENTAPRRTMEGLGYTGKSSVTVGVSTTTYRIR